MLSAGEEVRVPYYAIGSGLRLSTKSTSNHLNSVASFALATQRSARSDGSLWALVVRCAL